MRLLLVLVCVITLAACGGGKKDTPAVKPPPAPTANANIIDSVINAYMRLKDAFVSDNIANVNLAANVLTANSLLPDSSNLANIPMKSTKMFTDICKDLHAKSTTLAAAPDMAAKRRVFKSMVDPMRKIVATHSSATVYLQHCPMAYQDSGADWLSFNPEIRNPFLPKTMLKCGLVQDTLKYVQ